MYLNVDEVESALEVATADPFTGFTELIPLPNLTWENFQCNAIKIGNGTNPGRTGVYFLGGLHSREWGSSDILINFIEKLEQAFVDGAGVTFGPKTFSAAEVATIVNTLDIYVFPQANPDGRRFSMDTNPNWRKNRRLEAPNSNACPGVDVNRNFDFLWDFPTFFDPLAPVRSSTNPCDPPDINDGTFIGPEAASEPETKNVNFIFDTFENIRFFIDVHSYTETILYAWGDDQLQNTDPAMNFQNSAFNGQRGIEDDAYREFIPAPDESIGLDLANTLRDGIQAVRGRTYSVETSFQLYPTSGTSTDYAYSRHLVDPSKPKITTNVIEWGSSANPNPFHPAFPEMQNIIDEVTCGLFAYCLRVRTRLTSCVITLDRSTFGRDEIEALLLTATPAVVSAAFYVVVDGFSAAELGITDATLSGIPDVRPAISFSPTLSAVTVRATACDVEGGALQPGPQRFTWTFEISFANTSNFTVEFLPVTMTASMSSTPGINVTGQAVMTLTLQPNPYEVDGSVSWLSTDVRTFKLLSFQSLPSTPGLEPGSNPNGFITDLINAYNDPMLPRAPSHPFDTDISTNEDESSLEIARKVGPLSLIPIFNFAVARVRYRALTTAATNVRVFFRLFQVATTGTEFQPLTTYATGGLGGTKIPLLGVVNTEVTVVPCFAAARVDPTNPQGLNAQTDPVNVQVIPADGSGAEVQAYFGCWLDINQTTEVIPRNPTSAAGPFAGPFESIQQAVIRSGHQCIVAEINFDPQPVPTGVSPSGSDKLAQRNLSIVGVASPHVVPQPFDIKPTAATLAPGLTPDELMIDWGNLPEGTEANIYLPGTNADSILSEANRLYSNHSLRRVDAHTLGCRARGVTYLPIPPGVGSNYAGLLTIELPETVRRGPSFKVITRQITNAFGKGSPVILLAAGASTSDLVKFRRVIGSFQLTIPVTNRVTLLQTEERLLSVLRWIARAIPGDNRWFPIFERYLGQVGDRVTSLGGDPDDIVASPDGDGRRHDPACEHTIKWLLPLIIAPLLVLIALAPVIWTGPLAAAGIVLLVAVLWYWRWRCKPSLCDVLCSLLLGIGVAAMVIALIAWLGYGTPGMLWLLSILAVLNGFLIIALTLRRCCGHCAGEGKH